MAIEDIPAIITESEDEIRTKLLSYLPTNLSQEVDSWARSIVEVMVMREVALRDTLNTVLRQTFVATAYGQFLDGHADNFGLVRSIGVKSSGVVRFTAPSGTAIPPETKVQVPSLDPDAEPFVYKTTNLTTTTVPGAGYVDIEVIAEQVGSAYNQSAGAITLLVTSADGVSALANITPTVGGADAWDDETLRIRLEEEAKNPPGAGNASDFRAWVLDEMASVGDVAVAELWDDAGTTPATGNPIGSVLLSLRDAAKAPVDWSEVERTQKFIDPTRQMVAVMEAGEPWAVESGAAALSWTPPGEMGETALTLTYAGSGTTVVALDRSMDLSRFMTNSELFLWLNATWGAVSGKVRFQQDDSNYYEVSLSTVSSSGLPMPSSGSDWWLYRAYKSQFTATGSPSWSAITRVELELTAGAAGDIKADHFSWRDNSGLIGEGRAPIGMDVSVITPVTKAIDVAASLTLDAGYTLTGATGTTNIAEQIKTNLRAFLATLKPGDAVKLVDIENVIHDTPGVLDFVVTSPSSNIPVTLSQYATVGTLTLS